MARVTLELVEGQMARLQGPARLRVVRGQVMILGAIFKPGDVVSVSEFRSYAVKALVDSSVEVLLDYGGVVEKPRPGEEPLDEWVAAIDSLVRRGCRSFMVLGPTDAGKSSVTALIVNRALEYGMRPGVVDADVGQADVGPPACVSAALPGRRILWLREVRAERFRFIGYVTPQRAERRIVAAVVDLVGWLRRRGAEVVAVDTDGWVQGVNSIEYKVEAARFASIDALIVVGDQKLYRMLERQYSRLGCGVYYLRSPQVRRERDREERRSLRGERYRAFLSRAVERVVDLSEVSVQGSCFFSGELLPPEVAEGYSSVLRVPVEAASETYDTVYVVTRGQPDPAAVEKLSTALGKQVYILDKRLVPGTLAAIVGASGMEESLAIIRDIDLRAMKARIATPHEGEVKGLILGGIRLGEDFEETGRPLRCVI